MVRVYALGFSLIGFGDGIRWCGFKTLVCYIAFILMGFEGGDRWS